MLTLTQNALDGQDMYSVMPAVPGFMAKVMSGVFLILGEGTALYQTHTGQTIV